jgi:hypothetical protein
MESANENGSHTNNSEETKNQAMKQFYFIITLIFIILLVFLGFFIYNLIKCYLPKWRAKKELVKGEVGTNMESRRIEFEEI